MLMLFLRVPYFMVTVLEGRDRVGGRIRTETMGMSLPLVGAGGGTS